MTASEKVTSTTSVVPIQGPINCVGKLKWDPMITNPMFVDLVDLLRCHNCKKLSYNVHNLSKCDHVLCTDCKNGITMRKCPVCKVTTTEVKKDFAYESLVKDIRMLNQQYLKISFADKNSNKVTSSSATASSKSRPETEAKESPLKEPQVKEPLVKPPKVTESQVPESKVKEPQGKDKQGKETVFKAPRLKEAKMKESKSKELEAKESQVKEPEVKESLVREPKSKGSKVKESPVKEPRPKRVKLVESPAKEVEPKGTKAKESPVKESKSKGSKTNDSLVKELKSKGSKSKESPVKESKSKGSKTKDSPSKEPRSKRAKVIESPIKESESRVSKSKESPVKESKSKRQKIIESPVKEPKSKGSKAKESPAKELKSKASKVRESPVKEPRSKRAKVIESPVKESKSKESPVKESKAKESPVKESKAKGSKANESPFKEPKMKGSRMKESQIEESELSFDDDSVKSKGKGKKLIASTLLSEDQKKILDKFSKTLGIKVTSEFPKTVTHLVTKSDANKRAIRSMKYMKALMTNKWIVSFDWITQSLQAGELVPEEPFEIVGTTKQLKPQLGAPYKSRTIKDKLFADLIFYFDGKFKAPDLPRLDDLRDLVTSGGGTVINFRRLNTSLKKNEKVVIVKDEIKEDDKTSGNGKVISTTDLLNVLTAYDISSLIN